ncbi:MAG: histidine--tRNA ligase [Chloroflexi bacterium]|nr:MAG: histidine--tRNA ligase [Chloroflexota bacterium]
MPPIAAPRGTNDLLPDASSAWRWLHETHARVVESFGYRLVDSPIFEHTELFERGVGTSTDVVEKQMYTFTDRGGRSLTLRPEGTAGVLRAVMAGNALAEVRPARVHYAGPMFRSERPQKGRYHQFQQVGIECIGERAAELDVEVIEAGWRFITALGLADVDIQVNSLGDLEDRQRFREALLAYYRPLADRLCDDCRRRLEVNPLRLLDCKRDAAPAAAAPLITDSLSATSAAYFDDVLSGLRAAGIAATLNPRLVRGLDYYAHTAFEYWHGSLQGSQNALGGGGRYDGLAEVLGFASTPATGYALGVERLLLVARQMATVPPSPPACEAVVCSVEPPQAAIAADLARQLREAGLRVVLDALDRKLDRKLRAADRLGASAAVIVGEDEARDGMATVRDLRQRTQRRVGVAGLVAAVRATLASPVAG